MTPPGFIVSEEKAQNLLVLIVDKKGIFGHDIAQKIDKGITTVLLTARQEQSSGNTLVVAYNKTIPVIPEGDYTHMFFVWDGSPETLHVLEPLLKKAAADGAQFLFITDYHCYTEKLIRFIHQEYSKAQVVFVGDVFGNEQYESKVTEFFNEACKNNTIQLENVGLQHVYPVLFADVVQQLVKLGFGTSRQKLFLACVRHGMTELTLCHVLQKIDPLLKIDFKKEETKAFFLPEGEYLFDTDYDIVRKVQDAYTDLAANKNANGSKNKETFFFSPHEIERETKTQKKRKNVWKIFLFAFLFLLVSPLFLTLLYAGLGGIALLAAGNAIQAEKYNQAVRLAQTSEHLFSTAISADMFFQKEVPVFSIRNTLLEGKLLATLVGDGAKAGENFSLVAQGKSLNPSEDFLSGVSAIKNGILTLETSGDQANFEGISFATIFQYAQPIGNILDVTPTLFGFSGKKHYMVLFQNNTELRPGGGFIGSYALVTFDQGKMSDVTIHDVYDADGQLKGHIEPPYVIRRYIPQQHWYLRDSNFNVDFSQDAATAAFFLEQETGQKVDGVIGIDLTFVKDVLLVVGPVYVPEYAETVSANNFFFLTESHAEKNTFAGSTQKKDFLGALFSALLQKLHTAHTFSLKSILPIFSALQEKDVVFGFSDPHVQDVFTVNGLSGALWDGRKGVNNSVNDITGINEANIGVNKANYFVTRKVGQQMRVDKTGSISTTLSLTYKNTSILGQWPGGPYKNYLRIIMPIGASLVSIAIDGKTKTIVPAVTNASIYEAKDFIPPQGLEVDSSVEQNKQMYGFIVTIPEQTTQKIVVTYTLSQKIDMTQPTFSYNGWLFKQPGVDAYPYDFSLSVPSNFSVLKKSDWIQGNGNTISFNRSFGEDTSFPLVFAQK